MVLVACRGAAVAGVFVALVLAAPPAEAIEGIAGIAPGPVTGGGGGDNGTGPDISPLPGFDDPSGTGGGPSGQRRTDGPDRDVGGAVPSCGSGAVIGSVVGRQRGAATEAWGGVAIAGVGRVATARTEPGDGGSIARTFCVAEARLDGGDTAPLYYVVSGLQGFASLTWGVEFCLAGHDVWRVYGADCRALR